MRIMKSKKVMVRIVAIGLAATMLAGCGSKSTNSTANKKSSTEESIAKDKNIKSKNSSSNNLVGQIKAKYGKQDNYEYAEPLYNLDEEYVFEFTDLSDKFMELDEFECFKVFTDSSLENFVDIRFDKDYDNNTLSFIPIGAFELSEPEGNVGEDGNWGSKSKFWLVQYYDMETGKKLDKPIITIFTIARELGTPTLTQSVESDGYYALSWTGVEGADYYEVYEYDGGMDFATLQYTTEETSCNYKDLKTAKDYDEHWNDTFGGTSVDTELDFVMNEMMESIYSYFVVAKSNDDKVSGMSNMCDVEDIAGSIPYTYSDKFQTDYEGDSILALPAYVDVQMVDESVGQFLIDYEGAKIALLNDQRIYIEAKIKNLPISMMQLYLKGVDWDTFRAEEDKLKERQEQLSIQTGTTDKDIDIPYVPDSKPDDSKEEPETETEEPETDTEETETDTEEIETDTEEPETENEETETETEKESEPETKAKTTDGPELSEELSDTIYANSALSEWIAINMLNHESTIPLDDFNEASDSDYLSDALLEAYIQNPLIGIMDSISYNYDINSLEVTYIMSAEDTESMQKDSLAKAAEIAGDIIKSDMSDYEKEAAINEYICKNASYNEEVLDYISEAGTVDDSAVSKFPKSFTPYGILVDNYGVCESYAEAFLLIAKEAGLEAVIETGQMQNVNHEWNRVKIDDSWYTLDVTNNDCDYIPNSYFNIPDEVASQVLNENNEAFIDSYISNYTSKGMDNEYYTKNNRYTESADEAVNMLSEQLKSENQAAIRMDLNYGGSDIAEIVQNTLTKAGVGEAMYYYTAGVISVLKK